MLENRHIRRRLQHERVSTPLLRWPAPDRAIVLALAFLALIVQIIVVQTHIHIPQATGELQTVSLVSVAGHGGVVVTDSAKAKGELGRDKYPINEDPSNCPLCQEFAHSGQFVHSVTVVFALPVTVNVSFIVLCEAVPILSIVSHNWRGRAPPQA